MIAFTTEKYEDLESSIKELRYVVSKIRGYTITKEQKFQLDYLSRRVSDLVQHCQK